jgi:hypothetical protein
MRHDDHITRYEARPEHTDDDVVDLAEGLLGPARVRRCWTLFLSSGSEPVPLVIPFSDQPYEPDEHVGDFASALSDICASVGADRVVIVWERPGATRMYPVDWAWADAVACACAEHGVDLRGQLLLHADGVTFVEFHEDDSDPDAVVLVA